MALEVVEGMIVDALADEQNTGRLANALRERAAAHGRSPGDDDVLVDLGEQSPLFHHSFGVLGDHLC